MKILSLAAVATISLISSNLFAGTRTGNGGGSWVCREKSTAVRWLILEDLFEATEEFGLFLDKSRVSADLKNTQTFLKKISPELQQKLEPYLDRLNLLQNNPPSIFHTNNPIVPTGDSKRRVTPHPSSCLGGTLQFEQIVDYKDDGMIIVQKSLFELLSNRDRMALLIHEALYAYRRDQYQDTHSDTTRRIVGIIFSTLFNDSQDHFKKSIDSDALWIPTGQTTRISVNGTRLTRVTGHPEYGEAWQLPPTGKYDPIKDTVVEVPGLIWTDIWDNQGLAVNVPHNGVNGVSTSVIYSTAEAYCQSLRGRLPTWNDVQSLIRHVCRGGSEMKDCTESQRSFPTLPWVSSEDSSSRFWTSTRRLKFPTSSSPYWHPYRIYLNELSGEQSISAKDRARVRCVIDP